MFIFSFSFFPDMSEVIHIANCGVVGRKKHLVTEIQVLTYQQIQHAQPMLGSLFSLLSLLIQQDDKTELETEKKKEINLLDQSFPNQHPHMVIHTRTSNCQEDLPSYVYSSAVLFDKPKELVRTTNSFLISRFINPVTEREREISGTNDSNSVPPSSFFLIWSTTQFPALYTSTCCAYVGKKEQNERSICYCSTVLGRYTQYNNQSFNLVNLFHTLYNWGIFPTLNMG